MYYYYADGDYFLIRVDVGPRTVDEDGRVTNPPTPEEFYAAPAQRYTSKYGWIESRTGQRLQVVAIWSGDYYPVDEEEAQRVQAAIDGR